MSESKDTIDRLCLCGQRLWAFNVIYNACPQCIEIPHPVSEKTKITEGQGLYTVGLLDLVNIR
jgi:hypothetical protein